MKGCLKLTSPVPSPRPESPVQHLNNGPRCCHIPTSSSGTAASISSCINTANTVSSTQSQTQAQMNRKCVAFCAEGSEKVYTADEWDRTPSEPARNLSYQDLLELKEIQRSLPHANQPPDVVTGRPGKQFLSTVPIVLLPLLSPGANSSGESAPEADTKKHSSHSYFPDVQGRTNGHANGHTNGNGWGPPSLTGFRRQASSTPTQGQSQAPVRPSFPFPPRPVPFTSSPPTSNLTAARAPAMVNQPWPMNFQSQKPSSSSLSPSSPTSPYPTSYSNRPSSTPTSPTSPASPTSPTFPRAQAQTQPRMPWTAPHSLNHLMPSTPIKPREKPKFEFVTLLDTGAGANGGSPNAAVTSGGASEVDIVDVTTPKVGPEVLHPRSKKLPPGLIEVERESHRDHSHDDEPDIEDHDLNSVTSSSSCPSLCASSCPSSCSASEVDTDHEHEPEIETGVKHYSPKRYAGLDRYGYAVGLGARSWADVNVNKNGLAKLHPTNTATHGSLLPPPSPLDLDVGPTAKPKRKEKKKKFILVNDMEMELDESESEEEDPVPLSGRITSTSTSTTRETTTTTTTKTSTTEKTTTVTTTTISSSGSPSSPASVVAPAPIKSTLRGSPHLPTALMSLITPPTTPPLEQISRYNTHKPPRSPTSSPSAASHGRMKGSQKKGSPTSRERSGSMGSDTSGGGGSSPSLCSMTRIGSPVKVKSKMS